MKNSIEKGIDKSKLLHYNNNVIIHINYCNLIGGEMKHPCAGCKFKAVRGRVTCPILWREMASEGCGKMHQRTPTQALEYFRKQMGGQLNDKAAIH